jgi:hypothetical protein
VHQLAQSLDLAQHTSRRVDVRDGDHLVLPLLERLLHLVELRPVADLRLELCDLDAVCLETVGERVGKVARVQDEHLLARLDQVGRDLVPAKRAGARDDKGLRGGVGGLEELAQILEDSAEAFDEGPADMRLTASCQYAQCAQLVAGRTCGGSSS